MSNTENLQDGSLEHIQSIMDDTEKVEYEYDGHKYWFEYKKNLSWSKKMEIAFENIANDSADLDDLTEDDLDLSGLQQDTLREKIVDSNIDKINIFLSSMPEELGDALIQDILDDDIMDSELGNLKKL